MIKHQPLTTVIRDKEKGMPIPEEPTIKTKKVQENEKPNELEDYARHHRRKDCNTHLIKQMNKSKQEEGKPSGTKNKVVTNTRRNQETNSSNYKRTHEMRTSSLKHNPYAKMSNIRNSSKGEIRHQIFPPKTKMI